MMRKNERRAGRRRVPAITTRCRSWPSTAEDRFLSRLAGVTEPEQKRKIIGSEFIRVFEEEAAQLGTPSSSCRARSSTPT